MISQISSKKLRYGNFEMEYTRLLSGAVTNHADIMFTKNWIYDVNRNFASGVYFYDKNPDGTIKSYRTYSLWRNNGYPSVLDEICANGSSVPYAYTVYTDPRDGLDYLIGWSSTYNRLVLFKLQDKPTDYPVATRTPQYITEGVDRTMGSYSRAGWDGGTKVHFFNRSGYSLWEFDIITQKLTWIGSMPSSPSVTSSYTGGGLVLQDGILHYTSSTDTSVYWSALYYVSRKSVSPISNFTYLDAAKVGYSNYNNDVGTLFMSPLGDVAYYCYYGNSTLWEFKVNKADPTRTYPFAINFTNKKDSVHGEDYNLIFNFSRRPDTDPGITEVKYRLWVNGTYVYPSGDAWTGMNPIPSNHIVSIPNSYFGLYNNSVRLEMIDNKNQLNYYYWSVSSTNEPAQITMRTDKESIHSDYLALTIDIDDEPTDVISYQIEINDNVIEPWTQAGYLAPLQITRNFSPGYFTPGDNKITIKVKSTFKSLTVESSKDIKVVKTNEYPSLSVKLKGRTLEIKSDDTDGDKVRFRVTVNKNQLIPEQGYSLPFPSPYSTEYVIPRDKVNLDQVNEIVVDLIDQCEDKTSVTLNEKIGYSGLMFSDPAGVYYTDDIGQLLKYLDIGTVMARETSNVYEVKITNTLGYPVTNLSLEPLYDELDPLTEIIEISKTNVKPFDAYQRLDWTEVLNHDESVTFYVRLNAKDGAAGEGKFRLLAKADPAF